MSNLKMLFTGDVCFKIQRDVTKESAKGILSELMPDFDAADLRVMNLETPLAEDDLGAPIPKSGPNIIGRPHNLGFLAAAGCDCASLANNHTKDFGEEPLMNTIALLEQAGIAHAGAGRNIAEAYKAWRAEKNGIRVSVICVCENEFGIADEELSGTAGFQLERLADKIREEKTVSDFVLVFFHGGCEHNPLPSPLCRERYRMIIRLGADALIGGHTHCIQGMEIYEGKPIFYSMGNFLFVPTWEAADGWYYGYMVQLTLEIGKPIAYQLIPYRMEKDGSKINRLEGEEKARVLAHIDTVSAPIADTKELTRLYKGWCAISGISYIKNLVSDNENYKPENLPAEGIAPLKNLFSCEAHNELIRTTLNIAFTGELKDAYIWADEIRELQKV